MRRKSVRDAESGSGVGTSGVNGSTSWCRWTARTSALTVVRLRRRARLSGPVINWWNGPAAGANASWNSMECVDPAPWDGVTR